MSMNGFVSQQLRKPSGLYGRLVMPRRLKRLNAAINRSTLDALELEPHDRVLEVGFGPGELISAILPLVPAGSVSGADFSPEMVAVCARRVRVPDRERRVDLRCAPAESLPFDDGRFTKACTVNTLYFWPDPLSPLREFYRVLTDGGRLVVAFSPRVTMQHVPVDRHVFTLHDPEQVHVLLDEAGFRAVRMQEGAGPLGEFVCAIGSKL